MGYIQQFLSQLSFRKIVIAILGQSNFDCICKLLSTQIGDFVNIPALLNEPILEVVKRHFLGQEANQFISQIGICKHDPQCYTN